VRARPVRALLTMAVSRKAIGAAMPVTIGTLGVSRAQNLLQDAGISEIGGVLPV